MGPSGGLDGVATTTGALGHLLTCCFEHFDNSVDLLEE
jgi:hypothetical protein